MGSYSLDGFSANGKHEVGSYMISLLRELPLNSSRNNRFRNFEIYVFLESSKNIKTQPEIGS